MNNFILDDVECFETDKRIEKRLLELREADKKRLNIEKIPLDTFSPSISMYKKQARSLQSAFQVHRDGLLKHDKISFQASLHVISNIYGFENWQTLTGTVEDFEKKESDPLLINFIENKYQIFLDEFKANEDFFNEKLLGNREEFIFSLSKLIKKSSKLNRILSDERVIDSNVVSLVIHLVKNYCYFYISLYASKFEQFVTDLWEGRDLDEIAKFDPISFSLDHLDKLQIIFERLQVRYVIIHLIHSTRILEKNNQSFQQVRKIINILVYCLASLTSDYRKDFGHNKELLERLDARSVSINVLDIAERYYLT